MTNKEVVQAIINAGYHGIDFDRGELSEELAGQLYDCGEQMRAEGIGCYCRLCRDIERVN